MDIYATTFNCPPTNSVMSITLSDYATINFTSNMADHEDSLSDLRIIFTSLPAKGIITYFGGNLAVINTAYANSDFVYTSNPGECLNTYSEIINWKSIDTSDRESTEATFTINSQPFNCRPDASNISLTLPGNSTLNFTNYVADNEDSTSDLKIKLDSLISKGTFTSSGTQVFINTKYGNEDIVFNSNDNQCSLVKYYTEDTFYWKSVDTANKESVQKSFNLNVVCPSFATSFFKVIKTSITINFADYISDFVYADSALFIRVTSFPTKGNLTVYNNNVVINQDYGIDTIAYTLTSPVANNCYDSFTYKVIDVESAVSKEATVKLVENKDYCSPDSYDFATTLTKTGGIYFGGYISDNQDENSFLRIIITSVPAKGYLTVSNTQIILHTEYEIDMIVYNSNETECPANYTDSFTYKVIDTDTLESSLSTVTIYANKFNCLPKAYGFSQELDQTDSKTVNYFLNFANYISDNEDTDSSLKIEFISLANFGVIGIGVTSDSEKSTGYNAAIDIPYENNGIAYTPLKSQCEPFTDSFTYKIIDTGSRESEEVRVNIDAPTYKGGENCEELNVLLIVLPILAVVIFLPIIVFGVFKLVKKWKERAHIKRRQRINSQNTTNNNRMQPVNNLQDGGMRIPSNRNFNQNIPPNNMPYANSNDGGNLYPDYGINVNPNNTGNPYPNFGDNVYPDHGGNVYPTLNETPYPNNTN